MQEGAADHQTDTQQIGAQHFADADLLCALDGSDRGEAEESETGQQDGERSEEGEKSSRALFGNIKFIEVIVEEMILEGALGDILFPGGLESVDHSGQLGSANPEKEALDLVRIGVDQDGADGVMHGGKMKIFNHAFHHTRLMIADDGLPKGLLGCPADLFCRSFVDDERKGLTAVGIEGPVGGQVGRCEADRHALVVREFEPARLQGGADPLARLLDFGVGQTDQREARQAVGEMHFDRHGG